MAWLLDTNVISELRKPRAEQRVLDFVAATPLSELYVSIVTFVELRFGIDRSPDAAKRAALEDWLGNSVRPMFDPTRILPVTEDVLLRWRALMEDGRKRGHTFSQPDLINRRDRGTQWTHGGYPRPGAFRASWSAGAESVGAVTHSPPRQLFQTRSQ